MPSILEQYRISDFLEWHREGKLELNPDFQRGSVWTPVARTYLIDTILRELPVPKIYLRTKIDVLTKKSIREVVDGQQRLRAIIDFGNDDFSLGKRAGEFAGMRYTTLSVELQQTFLSYALAVDQLLNASDEDVLEVFSRLNSYSVQLNAPEKRHAAFQGEFKWAVHEASARLRVLWDRYQVVGVRQRVRMEDDALMAEMFGILLEGIRDGGQDNIDKLYRRQDPAFEAQGLIVQHVDQTVSYIVENLADSLVGTPVLRAPHFLMLFAAVAHALFGIPEGEIGVVPQRDKRVLSDVATVRQNLLQIGAIVDSLEAPPNHEAFWAASKYTTQRIKSRKIRFPVYFRALMPEPITGE
jgi:hypothetical protein